MTLKETDTTMKSHKREKTVMIKVLIVCRIQSFYKAFFCFLSQNKLIGNDENISSGIIELFYEVRFNLAKKMKSCKFKLFNNYNIS